MLQASCRLDNNQAKRHLSCGSPQCHHTGTQQELTGSKKLEKKFNVFIFNNGTESNENQKYSYWSFNVSKTQASHLKKDIIPIMFALLNK